MSHELHHEPHVPEVNSQRRAMLQAAGAAIVGGFALSSIASAAPTASAARDTGSLGARLQGVQHFGLTVQNMERAYEFYTEVLGGTKVFFHGDFQGDGVQNTLLADQEIRANELNVNPQTIGVPDLRSGKQRLDVRFIQFDNVVIELLQYRNADQPMGGANSFAEPLQHMSPAFPRMMHIVVDGAGWQSVYDILTKDGFEVLVVQNPTISLEGDVAATERVIAQAKHPVILVGHSYGGMVITEAGNNLKVRSLAYIAAFAPDAGESVETLAAPPAPPGESKAPLLPPQDGYLMVDPSKFPTSFAADVDPKTTRFMAAAQVPWGLQAVQTKITKAAWKTKPTHFLVTTKDGMIPPTAQRTMAKRTGARTVEIGSSHAVMLSHPREVAAFITEAAAQAK